MRVLPVLLALLTATAATATPADTVDALLQAVPAATLSCGPAPDLECLREQLKELCSQWRDCTGICDSFVPGFGEIVAPYYDPRRNVVRGSMLAVEPMDERTLVGVIDYEIFVGLSFNVDC